MEVSCAVSTGYGWMLYILFEKNAMLQMNALAGLNISIHVISGTVWIYCSIICTFCR